LNRIPKLSVGFRQIKKLEMLSAVSDWGQQEFNFQFHNLWTRQS